MNVFNSLGSNYSLSFTVQALTSIGSNKSKLKLINFLEKKYSGKATLTYKGREALLLALQSLNLPENSSVAISGYTCYAVYHAVVSAGLTPEYLDIGSQDLNFSSKTLESHLQSNPQIKAVIIQNTLGLPCDIEAIAKICRQENLTLIEDLAHSVGTKYPSGKGSGTVGDIVCLSFSQDKIIDGISGGAVVVRNKIFAKKSHPYLKHISHFNQFKDRYYPLDTLLIRLLYPIFLGKLLHFLLKAFALLSTPMDKTKTIIPHNLPAWYAPLIYRRFKNQSQNLSHRRQISQVYADKLDSKVQLSKFKSRIEISANVRFPIVVNNRGRLIKHLKKIGIYISDIWYDAPIAPSKYLPKTNYAHQCPNSEKLSQKMLNLPTHQNISPSQALIIAQEVNLWLKSQ